jgi:hypothetical protein
MIFTGPRNLKIISEIQVTGPSRVYKEGGVSSLFNQTPIRRAVSRVTCSLVSLVVRSG